MDGPKIAIVGYSTRLPRTTDERFWADLIAERNLLTEVASDRWAYSAYRHPDRSHPGTSVSFSAGSLGDVAGFDAGFFRISPREAASMDPQQRLLLEMSWEALSHAGAKPSTLRGKHCGVFIGLASIDYAYRQADDLACIGPHSATGLTASIAANRLSYFYDWRGPSLVVDTACSSGLVAFHQACRSLLSGESDIAVTGAINLHLHPFGFVIFSKASMLSSSGKIRPFQAEADGYVRSEGGGVFVLKPYKAALREGDRILAVVAHSAINTDGHKSGLTVPRVESQAALLRETYAAAGIAPDEVDYLEAHGTGTAVGDPIEVEAIGQALGEGRTKGNPLPIGSVKSNLGHLETASAVPSLLKAIHCLHQRRIPPTIGIDELNPNLPLDRYGLEIVTRTHALPDTGRLTIGVNSFGFGGANAHVVLQSPPPRRSRPRAVRSSCSGAAALPLMLSAATKEALRQVARGVREAIAGQEVPLWEASLYQLNFRREWLSHRALLWAKDRSDLLNALDAFAARGERAQQGQTLHEWHSDRPVPHGTVWVFSGNGCQWEGMGRELLEEPVFARVVDKIDSTFEPLAGYRLRDEMLGLLGENRYALTQFAQPALFALQVGQAMMLRERSLEASAVIGHSVGEVAAAWACGALSLADATRVVYFRSREQERARGLGQMTAVATGADAVAEWLSELGLEADVQIAALNSPRGSTVVGQIEALSRLETFLIERSVPHKRLPLDYPFHGRHMDDLRTELLEQLADLAPRANAIPMISTVTGSLIAGEALDADYWWRNVRAPVYFAEACATAAEHGELFVELGGHPVLRGYIQDILNHHGHSGRVIETLRRDRQTQREALRETAGALWIAGVPPQWDRHFPQTLPFVDLPHYPWERGRHWHAVTPESTGLLYRHPVHPLLGHLVAGHPGLWEQCVDTATFAWLADHSVGDGAIFPGAGYAELMLAAGAQSPEGESSEGLRVEGLEILAPMLLEENVGKILRTRLAADGSVEIHSRPQLNDTWTLHAKGRVSRIAGAPDAPFEPAEPQTTDHAFDAAKHYALAEAAGLNYGPTFRTVTGGCYRGDRLWARLCLKDTPDEDAYHLHPALLDGAFQLFINRLAAETPNERGWGFVPVRLEQLSWFPAAKPAVEARVRLLRRSPQSFLAEVQLLDAQGQVCATGRGVRMRRLRLRRRETERLRLFQNRLQPLPRREVRSPIDADALIRNTTAALAENTACQLYAQEYGPLLTTYLDLDDSGTETDEGIDAEALWQTLLQDYPDFLHWTLAAGRRRLAATSDAESGGSSEDELSTGYRRTVELPIYDLAAALTRTVRERLHELPAASSLGVLELTDGLPELLPRLADARESSRLRLFHADPSRREPCDDCNWRTFGLAASPEHLPPLDLIWAHLDTRNADTLNAVLDLAETGLRPGGWLLISGLEPEFWWQDLGLEAEGASCDDCLEALSDRCLSAQVLRPNGANHWLLLAQHAPHSSAEEPAGADWLLVGAAQADTEALAQTLQARNQSVRTLAASTPSELTASLDGVSWSGETRAVLYHLTPQATAIESPAGALGEACETLRRLGQWALRQDPLPRLDVLLPGALAEAGDDGALLAGGVAGFARTLQNEWPALNLRLLDADLSDAHSRDALLRELLSPDAEREIRLDAEGGRYVARVEESVTARPPGEAERPVRRLSFSAPGQLRHLAWSQHPALHPGPHEVEVEVGATGLNFRDVMYTLGLLSDEALENGFSGPTLGLEFAGTLTAVGEQVEGWSVGDRVLGFAAVSFGNRLITLDSTIAPLPQGMSLYEGATIPTVFFTAWYALHELARLQPGERLLVHGGAGGIGIAAIQIAQQAGIEVMATAGTPAKRDFLRLLGVKHVYDSRTLDFADDILRDTKGEGVDIVLNSLAGEAMRRSVQLLKPFGRFLELGKRDFYADTALGLRPMRNNLSYFGIDADQMLAVRPELTQRIFRQCLQGFNDGTLFPLPATVFPSHGVVDAFRHMQQSRQIGKIVVDMKGPFLPQAPSATEMPRRLELAPEGVYLVTGGTSGFGLETAVRLAQRGARKLVLVSRSGSIGDASPGLEALRRLGVEPHVCACDVSDAEQVRSLMADLAAMGPLRGIVHAAAVIEDALADNLDASHLRQVLAPKVDGAWHLHLFSRDLTLDFFVVYSSIANLLGNVGQAAYLAANGWMESLVGQRRARGLPGTALQFGPIADAGFLTRNDQTRAALEKSIGGAALSATAALDMLETAILEDTGRLAVADLHWGAIRRYLPLAATPKYTTLDMADAGTTPGMETTDRRAHLMGLEEDEAVDLLGEWIAHEAGQILHMAPEKIDRHKKLGEMGFDSLMGMELALALEERLDLKVPTFVLSEEPTVHKLAQRLRRELLQGEPEDQAGAAERELTQLAERHGVDAQEHAAVLGVREA